MAVVVAQPTMLGDLDISPYVLQRMVMDNNVNAIEARLRRGMDPDTLVPVDDNTHPRCPHLVSGLVTLLQLACDIESRPLVFLLLKYEAEPNRFENPTFPSPLQAACRWKRLPSGKVSFGNHPIASLLLQYSADPDATPLHDLLHTPLHLAVTNNNIELMKLLIDRGAEVALGVKPNLRSVTCNRSVSALELLLNADSLPLMKSLMNVPITDVRKDRVLHLLCDHKWYCPLYCKDPPEARLDFGKQLTLIKTFLNWGADVNAVNAEGKTALHLAWSYLNVNLCYALVEDFDADYKLKDNEGNPPFDCHTSGKNALLLSLSSECRFDEEEVKQAQFIYFLLQCGLNPKSTDLNGQNALHYYCKFPTGDIEVLEALLSYCDTADINARAKNTNETPLWIAATCSKNRELVQLLLAAGADPNVRAKGNMTVLQGLSVVGGFSSIGWMAVDLCHYGAETSAEALLKTQRDERDDDDDTELVLFYELDSIKRDNDWLPFMQYLEGQHHGLSSVAALPDRTHEVDITKDGATKREFERTYFEAYLNSQIELPSVRLQVQHTEERKNANYTRHARQMAENQNTVITTTASSRPTSATSTTSATNIPVLGASAENQKTQEKEKKVPSKRKHLKGSKGKGNSLVANKMIRELAADDIVAKKVAKKLHGEDSAEQSISGSRRQQSASVYSVVSSTATSVNNATSSTLTKSASGQVPITSLPAPPHQHHQLNQNDDHDEELTQAAGTATTQDNYDAADLGSLSASGILAGLGGSVSGVVVTTGGSMSTGGGSNIVTLLTLLDQERDTEFKDDDHNERTTHASQARAASRVNQVRLELKKRQLEYDLEVASLKGLRKDRAAHKLLIEQKKIQEHNTTQEQLALAAKATAERNKARIEKVQRMAAQQKLDSSSSFIAAPNSSSSSPSQASSIDNHSQNNTSTEDQLTTDTPPLQPQHSPPPSSTSASPLGPHHHQNQARGSLPPLTSSAIISSPTAGGSGGGGGVRLSPTKLYSHHHGGVTPSSSKGGGLVAAPITPTTATTAADIDNDERNKEDDEASMVVNNNVKRDRPQVVVSNKLHAKDLLQRGVLTKADVMAVIRDLHQQYHVPLPQPTVQLSNMEWAMRRAGVDLHNPEILLEDCERIICCLSLYDVMRDCTVYNPKASALLRFKRTDYDEILPEEEHKFTSFPPLDLDTGEFVVEEVKVEKNDLWDVRSDDSYTEETEEAYLAKFKQKLREERLQSSVSVC
eukprot:TRINITY_DN59989_c0_g1_i1.p1 TRINITY_DN59989_c0_g1~~TRINITY_DN59989_c0_g1_i1.p1  ORF type:complete len:1235 (+),score=152.08 TRINITY_DN59989_c0_g1_i1:59-3763(+)